MACVFCRIEAILIFRTFGAAASIRLRVERVFNGVLYPGNLGLLPLDTIVNTRGGRR